MTSTTPYMIRAIYDWCMDEGFTPHILVDAEYDGVVVPEAHISDGTIILNLSMTAVKSLDLGNDWVLFSARFGGVPMDISVPVAAVRAIYAKENGVGCGFPEQAEQGVLSEEGLSEPEQEASSDQVSPPKKGPPKLKLVD